MKQQPENQDYLGIYMEPLVTRKMMKRKYRHPIFLYNTDYDLKKDGKELFYRLEQCVNIYEHQLPDFVLNSIKIIQHYEKYSGEGNCAIYTMGQSIRFRVVEDQEPMQISLFAFFMNYTMLIPPVMCGVDLHGWVPFKPESWTNGAWVDRMNHYIKLCRPYGNNRKIGEYVEWSKYLLNLWVSKVGHRLGLSISNNEFIEAAKRSKDFYESLSCTYPVPKGATISDMENLIRSRTSDAVKFIGKQNDLAISLYARNGLFNPTQLQEMIVQLPFKPNLQGHTIPFTSKTNVMMGIKDAIAHWIDACGGRKAEIVKLNVSDAGSFERSLCMLLSDIRYVDTNWECDSRHFRKKKIESSDHLEKLDGRVATLDPESDEYFIIDPDNVDLVGKLLYIKTPITCTHPRRKEGYICSACYGKLMAPLNRDIHIGRITGLNLADDMEQKLLSAKHALATETSDIQFSKGFDAYFTTYSCQIVFNQAMIDMSAEDPDNFDQLFLEFNLSVMGKRLDGEGRAYDRSVPEIVIYDQRDDSRLIIQEESGTVLYLSPDLVEDYFLPAIAHKGVKSIIQIPFSDLIDHGKMCCDVLFEYQYQNNDIPSAVLDLSRLLQKTERINSFESYDECLDTLLPMFVRGGIHLPDLQTEILITALIYDPATNKPVDWTKDKVQYAFYTIDKAIRNKPSATTSILYKETSKQIAGAYNTYEKEGTSDYDQFIYDHKD